MGVHISYTSTHTACLMVVSFSRVFITEEGRQLRTKYGKLYNRSRIMQEREFASHWHSTLQWLGRGEPGNEALVDPGLVDNPLRLQFGNQ